MSFDTPYLPPTNTQSPVQITQLSNFSWVFFSVKYGGMEVDSTPSLRHIEKILFKKVESPGQDELPVVLAVAAVLTGTQIWVWRECVATVLTGTVKPFGTTLKKE
jgi:hypothetical protein